VSKKRLVQTIVAQQNIGSQPNTNYWRAKKDKLSDRNQTRIIGVQKKTNYRIAGIIRLKKKQLNP